MGFNLGRTLGGLVGRSTHHDRDRQYHAPEIMRGPLQQQIEDNRIWDLEKKLQAEAEARKLAEEARKKAELEKQEIETRLKSEEEARKSEEEARKSEEEARKKVELELIQEQEARKQISQQLVQQSSLLEQLSLSEFEIVGRSLAPAAIAECLSYEGYKEVARVFMDQQNISVQSCMLINPQGLTEQAREALLKGAISEGYAILGKLFAEGQVEAATYVSKCLKWVKENSNRLLKNNAYLSFIEYAKNNTNNNNHHPIPNNNNAPTLVFSQIATQVVGLQSVMQPKPADNQEIEEGWEMVEEGLNKSRATSIN